MSRDNSGAWMTPGFSQPAESTRSSGTGSPSSEYKRQLRAQCIDQRNRQRQLGGLPVPESHRPVRSSTFRGEQVKEKWSHGGPERLGPEYSGCGVHRSNSSLEMDRGSGRDPIPSAPSGIMRRDYGSVNSLDKVDCFSTILRNYRQSMDEGLEDTGGTGKLSGRHRDRYGSHSGVPLLAETSSKSSTTTDSRTVYNGFLQPTDDLGSLVSAAISSPKSKSQKSKDRKTRSECGSSGGSIFRKLRGVKSDPYSGTESKAKVQPDSLSSAEGNPKLEDRIRRKAFCHYDCQSIGVSISEVIRRRTGSGGSEACLMKRTNTTTGASAASGGLRGGGTVDLAGTLSLEDPLDAGDGKNNDLIQSCPYFRNEIGSEEVRTVSFSRHVVERRRSGRLCPKDLVKSSECNGVSILDSSPSSDGTPEPPMLLYNNLVLEYIDQGAFYYRRFFYDYGTRFRVVMCLLVFVQYVV